MALMDLLFSSSLMKSTNKDPLHFPDGLVIWIFIEHNIFKKTKTQTHICFCLYKAEFNCAGCSEFALAAFWNSGDIQTNFYPAATVYRVMLSDSVCNHDVHKIEICSHQLLVIENLIYLKKKICSIGLFLKTDVQKKNTDRI